MSFDLTIQLLSPEEISAEEAYELCEVVDRAFGNPPSSKDTVEHIVHADRITLAKEDEKFIGFGSTLFNPVENLDDSHLVHHSMAIEPEYQDLGLSRVMSDMCTIWNPKKSEKYLVAGRTAHPAFLEYYNMDEKMNGVDSETSKNLEVLASIWGEEPDENLLFKNTFEQPMYSDENLEYFRERVSNSVGVEYDPGAGDAFLVWEKTNLRDKMCSLERNLAKIDYGILDGIHNAISDTYSDAAIFKPQ